MTHFVIDTNALVTANGRSLPSGATIVCVAACARQLRAVETGGTVVIDDQWAILNEYKNNVHESGQPGVGDAFLKWLLTNLTNTSRCNPVHVTKLANGASYLEFPQDPELANFDKSDRVFVAVALAHPNQPHILNATDSDWANFDRPLRRNGVYVDYLCPEYLSPSSQA